MSDAIPTYHLQLFAGYDEVAAEVFCPAHSGQRKPGVPIVIPHRSSYYKIGLCLRGNAELKVNLHTYAIVPGCVVLVTPDIIKQWTHFSDDYDTLSVLFTPDFLTADNAQVGKLGFLRDPGAHVLPLAPADAANIAASLRFLAQKYYTPHPQRRNIVRNVLNGLLYELGTCYDRPPGGPPAAHGRGQVLTAAFKQLVLAHSAETRSVAFYADKLCITPKHLTEMLREATGKTASELLAEAVVLEAKALLQATALPMARIADQLHFADQFAFSRFFKQRTGLSPTAYKHA